MRSISAWLGCVSAFVGLWANTSPLEAQDRELLGTVVSAVTGEPVAGAWIALQGWEYGTYSRRDGTFRLPNVPNAPRRYDIAALGYTSTTIQLEPTPGLEVALDPDTTLLPGVQRVLAHLDERRNGARLFDQEELAFSRAFSVAELLTMRGVRRVRRFCVDEHWEPGAVEMAPGTFYRIEIHGSTARIYTEEYLEEMARRDSATIRRLLRPEQPMC